MCNMFDELNLVHLSCCTGGKPGPQKFGMTGFKIHCSLKTETGLESRIFNVQRSFMSTPVPCLYSRTQLCLLLLITIISNLGRPIRKNTHNGNNLIADSAKDLSFSWA